MRNLYVHFPMYGGCYQIAFFLTCYLKERFGIEGQAVLGFVHDGMQDYYYSHAWYVMNGHMTDIAISRSLHPNHSWRGPLTIHGYTIAPGWLWSYHTETSDVGKRILKEIKSSPHLPPDKELHRKMLVRAESEMSMRAYLNGASAGWTYHDLAEQLDALHRKGI